MAKLFGHVQRHFLRMRIPRLVLVGGAGQGGTEGGGGVGKWSIEGASASAAGWSMQAGLTECNALCSTQVWDDDQYDFAAGKWAATPKFVCHTEKELLACARYFERKLRTKRAAWFPEEL